MIQAGKLIEIEQAIADLGANPGPVEQRLAPRPVATPAVPSRPVSPRPAPPPQRTGPSPFELDTIKKTGAAPRPAVPASPPASVPASVPAFVPAGTPPQPDPSASTGDWREKLHGALTDLGMAFTADAVEHSQFTQSGNELQVLAPTETRLSMNEADLQKAIAHLGLPRQNIRITFGEASGAGPALEKKKTTEEDEVTTRALSNPEVQRFRELFGGEVRAVRNLKE